MLHAFVGFAIGKLFGGTTLALTYASALEPPSAPALVSRGIEEVFFPVGCSLVLFTAQALGNRLEGVMDPNRGRARRGR